VKIVLAQQEDLSEILQLQKLCFFIEAKLYDFYDIPQLNQTLEEITLDFSSQLFLKAVLNGRIVGSVRAYQEGEACHVGRLFVHPDYQNRGLGTKLMNEIEALFKDAKRFELLTGHKNSKNLYLYQKLGYRIIRTEALNDKLTFVYLEKP
jgi:ribosomal protein S18 acetylase RimI-like enzyme